MSRYVSFQTRAAAESWLASVGPAFGLPRAPVWVGRTRSDFVITQPATIYQAGAEFRVDVDADFVGKVSRSAVSSAAKQPIGGLVAEVDVRDFGADVTGVNDSTIAFINAFKAVKNGEVLRLPAGTFTVAPDSVGWPARRIVGMPNRTIIRPSSVGEWVVRCNGITHIQDVTIEAGGCSVGLYLDGSNESNITRVIVTGANVGVYAREAQRAVFEHCRTELNDIGIKLVGCNATALRDHTSARNRIGVEVVGVNSGTGETAASGSLRAYNGDISSNSEWQVMLRGVEGGTYADWYIEALGQGVLVENSYGLSLERIRLTGGDYQLNNSNTIRMRCCDGGNHLTHGATKIRFSGPRPTTEECRIITKVATSATLLQEIED